MVLFLLHNTLGAWWAGKKLSANDLVTASSEDRPAMYPNRGVQSRAGRVEAGRLPMAGGI